MYRVNGTATALLAPVIALLALPPLIAAVGVPVSALLDNAAYLLVGIVGAIFANATGAGGGVVFIPLFSGLGFSDAEAVATSFGIQCFGMSTGALAWSSYYRAGKLAGRRDWSAFIPAIAVTTPASLTGLWLVQYLHVAPPAGTVTVFAVFSLLLGCAILGLRAERISIVHRGLTRTDACALLGVALVGGVVTGWLSVGVGEFVGFYLILRRYDVTQAIAVAVVISALTVWGAAPQALVLGSDALWEVVLTAGPGAVAGALIARWLAVYLGGLRLKRFFGVWLLVIGASELARLL